MYDFASWDYGLRPDELAHHGIKNMKWGIRRWQNEDGSLTPAGREHYGVGKGGGRALDRAYKRQVRKLNRLAQRTDVQKQGEIASKYDKRAKVAGGIAVGLAGAAVGSHFGTAAEHRRDAQLYKQLWKSADKERADRLEELFGYVKQPGGTDQATYNHMMNVIQGHKNDAHTYAEKYFDNKKQSSFGTAGVSTRTKILAGAAGVTAGYAAYAKIRSHVAKKRMTEVGHSKAVQKYKTQYDKMLKQFADTPYAQLLKNTGKNGAVSMPAKKNKKSEKLAEKKNFYSNQVELQSKRLEKQVKKQEPVYIQDLTKKAMYQDLKNYRKYDKKLKKYSKT